MPRLKNNQTGCFAGHHTMLGQYDKNKSKIKSIYTDWANHYLKRAGKVHLIEDLQRDFSDGVLLADVIEAATRDTVPDVTTRPSSTTHMLENIEHCLDYLAAKGINLEGVSALDVKDGNLKSILGLFFNLSRYTQQLRKEQRCSAGSTSSSTGGSVTPDSHHSRSAPGSPLGVASRPFSVTPTIDYNGPPAPPARSASGDLQRRKSLPGAEGGRSGGGRPVYRRGENGANSQSILPEGIIPISAPAPPYTDAPPPYPGEPQDYTTTSTTAPQYQQRYHNPQHNHPGVNSVGPPYVAHSYHDTPYRVASPNLTVGIPRYSPSLSNGPTTPNEFDRTSLDQYSPTYHCSATRYQPTGSRLATPQELSPALPSQVTVTTSSQSLADSVSSKSSASNGSSKGGKSSMLDKLKLFGKNHSRKDSDSSKEEGSLEDKSAHKNLKLKSLGKVVTPKLSKREDKTKGISYSAPSSCKVQRSDSANIKRYSTESARSCTPSPTPSLRSARSDFCARNDTSRFFKSGIPSKNPSIVRSKSEKGHPNVLTNRDRRETDSSADERSSGLIGDSLSSNASLDSGTRVETREIAVNTSPEGRSIERITAPQRTSPGSRVIHCPENSPMEEHPQLYDGRTVAPATPEVMLNALDRQRLSSTVSLNSSTLDSATSSSIESVLMRPGDSPLLRRGDRGSDARNTNGEHNILSSKALAEIRRNLEESNRHLKPAYGSRAETTFDSQVTTEYHQHPSTVHMSPSPGLRSSINPLYHQQRVPPFQFSRMPATSLLATRVQHDGGTGMAPLCAGGPRFIGPGPRYSAGMSPQIAARGIPRASNNGELSTVGNGDGINGYLSDGDMQSNSRSNITSNCNSGYLSDGGMLSRAPKQKLTVLRETFDSDHVEEAVNDNTDTESTQSEVTSCSQGSARKLKPPSEVVKRTSAVAQLKSLNTTNSCKPDTGTSHWKNATSKIQEPSTVNKPGSNCNRGLETKLRKPSAIGSKVSSGDSDSSRTESPRVSPMPQSTDSSPTHQPTATNTRKLPEPIKKVDGKKSAISGKSPQPGQFGFRKTTTPGGNAGSAAKHSGIKPPGGSIKPPGVHVNISQRQESPQGKQTPDNSRPPSRQRTPEPNVLNRVNPTEHKSQSKLPSPNQVTKATTKQANQASTKQVQESKISPRGRISGLQPPNSKKQVMSKLPSPNSGNKVTEKQNNKNTNKNADKNAQQKSPVKLIEESKCQQPVSDNQLDNVNKHNIKSDEDTMEISVANVSENSVNDGPGLLMIMDEKKSESPESNTSEIQFSSDVKECLTLDVIPEHAKVKLTNKKLDMNMEIPPPLPKRERAHKYGTSVSDIESPDSKFMSDTELLIDKKPNECKLGSAPNSPKGGRAKKANAAHIKTMLESLSRSSLTPLSQPYISENEALYNNGNYNQYINSESQRSPYLGQQNSFLHNLKAYPQRIYTADGHDEMPIDMQSLSDPRNLDAYLAMRNYGTAAKSLLRYQTLKSSLELPAHQYGTLPLYNKDELLKVPPNGAILHPRQNGLNMRYSYAGTGLDANQYLQMPNGYNSQSLRNYSSLSLDDRIRSLADDNFRGSQMSISSNSTNLTNVTNNSNLYSEDILKLRHELELSQMKVQRMSEELKHNAQLVFAFEHSLGTMTSKLQTLSSTASEKDLTLLDLRRTIEQLQQGQWDSSLSRRASSPSYNHNVAMSTSMSSFDSSSIASDKHQRNPSIDSMSTTGSTSNWLESPEHKKKKKRGWLLSSFRSPFSKKKSQERMSSQSDIEDTDGLSVPNSPTHTGTGNLKPSSSTSCLFPGPNNAESVAELKSQLKDKDLKLTETRLEALSAAHQLDQMKDEVSQLRHEMQQLRADNENLQRHMPNNMGGSTSSITSYSPKRRLSATESTLDMVLDLELGGGQPNRRLSLYVSASTTGNSRITIGCVGIGPRSTWEAVDSVVSHMFCDYMLHIDGANCLGLTSDSIASYTLGELNRYSGDNALDILPYNYLGNNGEGITIYPHNHTLAMEDALSFDTLISRPIVARYVATLLEHKRVILHGPSGTGKTYFAKKLAQHIILRRGSELQSSSIWQMNVDHKSGNELRQLIRNAIEEAALKPVVVILDSLHRLNDIDHAFNGVLDKACTDNLYILGTMNHHTSVTLHHNFRWIPFSTQHEPVSGYLSRALRRKLVEHEVETGNRNNDLESVMEWMPRVWSHLNKILEQHNSTEVTIGPRLFGPCPTDVAGSQSWFQNLWNYSVVPYMREAVRQGLQRYGKKGAWTDPMLWVKETYPWSDTARLSSLIGLHSEDVGFTEDTVVPPQRVYASQEVEEPQDPLLNMVKRLQEAAKRSNSIDSDSTSSHIA